MINIRCCHRNSARHLHDRCFWSTPNVSRTDINTLPAPTSLFGRSLAAPASSRTVAFLATTTRWHRASSNSTRTMTIVEVGNI